MLLEHGLWEVSYNNYKGIKETVLIFPRSYSEGAWKVSLGNDALESYLSIWNFQIYNGPRKHILCASLF